jgi:integrase
MVASEPVVACRATSWYPGCSRTGRATTGYHMPTTRIDTETVEAMEPDSTIWDTEARGFCCRRRSEDRVYAVKTRVKGRQVMLTIGRHGKGAWSAAKARAEAIRLLGLIRDGQDPRAAMLAEKATPLFSDFATRYLEQYAAAHKKPRTIAEDRRLLKLHIIPALGKTRLRDLDKAAVQRLHAGMKAAPVAGNRALALLSAILGWAEAVGERPDHSNPCKYVKRYPEKSRERLLTAPEMARLGDALERAALAWDQDVMEAWRDRCAKDADGLDEGRRAAWVLSRMPKRWTAEDWRAIAAFRLLIFTGARLSEILTLRWPWVNASQGVARLPDSKTGAKPIYLPPGALAVLSELPRFEYNDHVLPGDRPGCAFVGIQKPWQRVRALAGLPDVHIHDLRHAFASAAVASGDSLFIVGKLLGHRQASTTERYAHLAPDPALAVATRTAERLADMMRGGQRADLSNVTGEPTAIGG